MKDIVYIDSNGKIQLDIEEHMFTVMKQSRMLCLLKFKIPEDIIKSNQDAEMIYKYVVMIR